VADSGGEDQAMSEITTQKNILEDILRELSYKTFGNRWQRWFFKVTFWIMMLNVITLAVAVVSFQV
jgi:hypothetical protein